MRDPEYLARILGDVLSVVDALLTKSADDKDHMETRHLVRRVRVELDEAVSE